MGKSGSLVSTLSVQLYIMAKLFAAKKIRLSGRVNTCCAEPSVIVCNVYSLYIHIIILREEIGSKA